MRKLDDRICLITGAGGSIGQCVAESFAREGAVVVVNDIDDHRAQTVVDRINADRGTALAVQADVSRGDQVKRLFSTVFSTYGKVDILVNNAGIAVHSSLKAHSEEEWDRVIDTNLKSVFLCCRAALHKMIRMRKGRIINISSMTGISGAQYLASYAASKGAINALTKSLAREVGEFGITVNSICPGLIDTEMSSSYLARASKEYAEATRVLWEFRAVKRAA